MDEIRKVKDELHKMYPKYKGYIEHTLVAKMCKQYHEKMLETTKPVNVDLADISGFSDEQLTDELSNRDYVIIADGEHYE